jgi:RNA polymerase sigma-70 factor (ECF subfamily)
MAAAVRSETLSFLRSEKQTALQKLRDELPEDERMLLILRVDRRMDWNQIARVLTDETEGDALASAAARLRKRFQLLGARLKKRAQQLGLAD